MSKKIKKKKRKFSNQAINRLKETNELNLDGRDFTRLICPCCATPAEREEKGSSFFVTMPLFNQENAVDTVGLRCAKCGKMTHALVASKEMIVVFEKMMNQLN